MKFSSTQVKGKGRGKLLGFPTINLDIPDNFQLDDGIYAVKVFVSDEQDPSSKKEFKGALHFGPIPTFKEDEKTLEVFLIDTKDSDIPSSKEFEVETVKYLRPVMSFSNEEDLSNQIGKDVEKTKQILSL
jgi:riboflavin kinase/FMN adenylyltransferase